MNKLKIYENIERGKYALSKGRLPFLLMANLPLFYFSYFTLKNIYEQESSKGMNFVMLLLLLSIIKSVNQVAIDAYKDNESFEDYLIKKESKIVDKKNKIHKQIQENIMNNFDKNTNDERDNIIDNYSPAEMEKARRDLVVLNMQLDYRDGKLDTIYKLQKRIKKLIRNQNNDK